MYEKKSAWENFLHTPTRSDNANSKTMQNAFSVRGEFTTSHARSNNTYVQTQVGADNDDQKYIINSSRSLKRANLIPSDFPKVTARYNKFWDPTKLLAP